MTGGVSVKRIGILGAGNMGGAIIRGLMESGYVRPSEAAIYDPNGKAMEAISQTWPVTCCTSAAELCEISSMVVFAVKPQLLQKAIDECGEELLDRAVISIVAGWTTEMLADALGRYEARYLRVMPNTPAIVGEGMTALCEDTTFTKEEFSFAEGIFEAIGKTVILPERMFDGVTALSGSSPAMVYTLMETMADAGVREGIPRATALTLAAQTVLGSALMVLNSGEHPAALRDKVCSPAGTTIEAVAALEEHGFRNAILQAMKDCADRSRAMRE